MISSLLTNIYRSHIYNSNLDVADFELCYQIKSEILDLFNQVTHYAIGESVNNSNGIEMLFYNETIPYFKLTYDYLYGCDFYYYTNSHHKINDNENFITKTSRSKRIIANITLDIFKDDAPLFLVLFDKHIGIQNVHYNINIDPIAPFDNKHKKYYRISLEWYKSTLK